MRLNFRTFLYRNLSLLLIMFAFTIQTSAQDKEIRIGTNAGLGLSITNDIVKAHGSTLSVHSEPGVQSTFTILIPREQN